MQKKYSFIYLNTNIDIYKFLDEVSIEAIRRNLNTNIDIYINLIKIILAIKEINLNTNIDIYKF